LLDRHYATPTQHYNPIALFTTSCAWADGRLTVWEGSQNVTGIKNDLAEQLGIDPSKIRVVSPFIGGAGGSTGRSNWSRPATRASRSPPTGPRRGTMSGSPPTMTAGLWR
jgi:CO/xanthine dehydrogenase Mo-binding subunit